METVRRGNDWLKFQRHKLRINYIRKFRADGHLFDLGTGWGHFLETARQAGYRVSGVEVSKHQFTYAKEDLGLPVECVDFFQYKAEHGSIDIITMWDVLEHIDEVDGILSHIRELLSRVGLLVIQVPQIDSFIAKRTGRNWSMFSHTHVNYFSRKTMKQLLDKNGFEVLDFRSSIELKLLLMYVLYPFLRRLKGDKKEEITSNERQNYFNKVTRQPKWILKTISQYHIQHPFKDEHRGRTDGGSQEEELTLNRYQFGSNFPSFKFNSNEVLSRSDIRRQLHCIEFAVDFYCIQIPANKILQCNPNYT